jgi:hypothetical protein
MMRACHLLKYLKKLHYFNIPIEFTAAQVRRSEVRLPEVMSQGYWRTNIPSL